MDTQNPTGYAQVVEELQGGAVVRSYTWGHWLLAQTQLLNDAWSTAFYGYDGHGSARYLTDSAGAVTDTYDYDAFGNLITSARGQLADAGYAGAEIFVSAKNISSSCNPKESWISSGHHRRSPKRFCASCQHTHARLTVAATARSAQKVQRPSRTYPPP